MSAFKPINYRKYRRANEVATPDSIYWQRLSAITKVKEFGAINYVDFSPADPYYFAATSSVRVQIYNPITKMVVKNLSRFQEPAYGGCFRQDGRLLVAGDEQGLVKVFDTTRKNVLRLFRGHKAPVHRVFFTTDLVRVASFSDDRTVRLWDMSNENVIHTYEEVHSDYIRAGAISPVSTNIILSGSYDGKINMYDIRTQEIVQTYDHGCPVESLIFLPSGGIFLSAGGTEVRVWDSLNTARLLTKMSQHHKTVTCLRLGSNGRRIFSAGLDRHVKIYDVATYRPVHTLKYSSAVLSLGIAADDQAVVAGHVDGMISIQLMTNHKNSNNNEMNKVHGVPLNVNVPIVKVDHTIKSKRYGPKLADYDHMFRRYEYRAALDKVMLQKKIKNEPEAIVGVLSELIRRQGLERALVNRPPKVISLVIKFICRYFGETRFMRVLTDVTNILLDLYEANFNDYNNSLQKDFKRLAQLLTAEVNLTHNLLELQGNIELLILASTSESSKSETVQFVRNKGKKLLPSDQARDYYVVV